MFKLYGDKNNSTILNKRGDKLRGKPSKLRTFTNKNINEIRLLKSKMTISEIAEKYNKTDSAICNVLYKKNIYKDVPHNMKINVNKK